MLSQASYQVSDAVLTLTKSVLSVSDPFGGSSVVPGAVLEYEILVSVAGTGNAENVVVTDVLPASLAYESGTISVSLLPPGEDSDDDFAPLGTDGTGYDAANTRTVVTLGDIAGGEVRTIQFQASVK